MGRQAIAGQVQDLRGKLAARLKANRQQQANR
jgi:hypothetical protein